jgi:hypothetical protein
MTRQLKFLIGAIAIGVIFIGISMWWEGTVVVVPKTPNNNMGTNFSNLESKIKILNKEDYNPSNFISLIAEIHSSFSSELITQAGEDNLKLQLKVTQTNVLFSECESFLKGSSSNSRQLLLWLDELKTSYVEETEIDYFKGQINAYNYYHITLPNKINSFVTKGCYDDVNSSALITEIQKMSRLDNKYTLKFKGNNNILINKLQNYRSFSFDNYKPCP